MLYYPDVYLYKWFSYYITWYLIRWRVYEYIVPDTGDISGPQAKSLQTTQGHTAVSYSIDCKGQQFRIVLAYQTGLQ